MIIDINRIENILYVCNVNQYEMNIDTECECINIEIEDITHVDEDELLNELTELFHLVEINDNLLTLYFEEYIN